MKFEEAIFRKIDFYIQYRGNYVRSKLNSEVRKRIIQVLVQHQKNEISNPNGEEETNNSTFFFKLNNECLSSLYP